MTGWLRKLFGGGADTGGGSARTAASGTGEPFVVNLFDDRVVVHRPDGQREELEWDALSRVIVRASTRAPWAGKAWLILIGDDSDDDRPQGCVAPLDALNHEALLARLEMLPGFDRAPVNRAARDARSGMSRADAVCWRRGDNVPGNGAPQADFSGVGTQADRPGSVEANHERDPS